MVCSQAPGPDEGLGDMVALGLTGLYVIANELAKPRSLRVADAEIPVGFTRVDRTLDHRTSSPQIGGSRSSGYR
jgi:hypothetical protein